MVDEPGENKIRLIEPNKPVNHLSFQLNPEDRISASAAMMHPYFACFPSKIHLLPPTASIFVLPEVRCLQPSPLIL